jgi:CubicO group peptidase (beta-lactamase class C family)
MSFWERASLCSLLIVGGCAGVPGQLLAQGAGSGSAAAPIALTSALNSITAKFSIDQAWFYLRKDNGEVASYTHGDTHGVSQPLRIASLSKSLTAIGIALLIQNGQLTLKTRLGEVLPRYLQAKGHQLDPTLAKLDIEHILAHRAGLRTNLISDPKNGLSSSKVLELLSPDAHFSDYLLMSSADNSDGTSEYRYSNLSYVILGMVIEAVSGQSYETFCQIHILEPLRISGRIPPDLRRVAPFGGWEMSEPDLLRLWAVFDVNHPSLLTRQILEATLLSRSLPPTEAHSAVYYTLGTYVRQDAVRTSYSLSHNGILDFVRGQPHVYSYAEKVVPGYAWMFVFQTPPLNYSRERRAITTAVRAAVIAEERE